VITPSARPAKPLSELRQANATQGRAAPAPGKGPHEIVVGTVALAMLNVFIYTGFLGIDFGYHWDEWDWHMRPLGAMIESETLLPNYYCYPSVDYWICLASLAPDVPQYLPSMDKQGLLGVVASNAYRLRTRLIFLLVVSFTLIWMYLGARARGRGPWEALVAACCLGLSWEVAYHARFIAPDAVLMQFAALTLACVSAARRSAYPMPWLQGAAIAAGLGCGTKYPGALLMAPVVLTWCRSRGRAVVSTAGMRELVKLVAAFVATFLISTPGSFLQPTRFLHWVTYVQGVYANGLFGYTIKPGWEHISKIGIFFIFDFFSHYPVISCATSLLVAVGVLSLLRDDPWELAILLVFPATYLVLFSRQGVMFLRNLLVVGPFLALFAARGAAALWEEMRWPAARVLLVLPMVAGFAMNAWWLIHASETIARRSEARFAREAAEYITSHPSQRFLRSRRVRELFEINAFPSSPNLTDDPELADRVVFFAKEAFPHDTDWPCNDRKLSETWFGPYEVNFNYYASWSGEDRILVLTAERARDIGIAPIRKDRQRTE
jgi:Dolichyl-phosphate-mannose-protein mannosyltransferase